MELIKYGTKEGMKYGLKDKGQIVVPPTFDSREELIDHYNETKCKTTQSTNEQSK